MTATHPCIKTAVAVLVIAGAVALSPADAHAQFDLCYTCELYDFGPGGGGECLICFAGHEADWGWNDCSQISCSHCRLYEGVCDNTGFNVLPDGTLPFYASSFPSETSLISRPLSVSP